MFTPRIKPMFEVFPPTEMTSDSEMSPPDEAVIMTPPEGPLVVESLDIHLDFTLPPPAIEFHRLPETPSATPKRVRSPELKRVLPIPAIIITSPGGTNCIPHLGYWREG